MNRDPNRLRDHLLDPSGGLVYHLRALRHRRGLWAPFHRVLAGWLAGWQPERRELVIVGPSAGYALPAGFLARFGRVTALEPDPLARRLLARRPDAGRLGFSRLDCLASADGLAWLAATHPDAAILFSNVLGQRLAPGGDWRPLLARHLAGHAWASYHDVISTTARPKPGGCHAPAGSDQSLAATLARFWPGGTIELTDHETFRLGGDRPHGYTVWPITRRRWQLVEWADNSASTTPCSAGACQDSCHLSHAAKGCLFVLAVTVATTDSRSGLSVTGPVGDQFRVWRDQRAGWRSRASTYKA